MRGACDERFRLILDRLGARSFEDSEDVVYGLWSDFTLVYTNPSWARFAVANGASELFLDWGLGRSVLDACEPALRPFYERVFRQVIETAEPFVHEYVCHAPEVRRRFVMRVMPAAGALLVSHSLVAEVRMGDEGGDGVHIDSYRATNGLIQQCPHCRRVRAVASATPNRWDLVPALLARQSATSVSHVLCPTCFAYHYHRHFTPDELSALIDEMMGPAKSQG